jgi:phage terminase small subunit
MNASDAYREVYDVKRSTSKSVNEMASRLLKNLKVASMIAEIRATAEKTTILTVEQTRTELARVCFSDVRKLFNPDGSLKKISELDADTAAAVASFEVDGVEVGDKVVRRTIKVKLWDKNAALEMAIKHLGLYERDNTQRSENLSLQVVLVRAPTNERELTRRRRGQDRLRVGFSARGIVLVLGWQSGTFRRSKHSSEPDFDAGDRAVPTIDWRSACGTKIMVIAQPDWSLRCGR